MLNTPTASSFIQYYCQSESLPCFGERRDNCIKLGRLAQNSFSSLIYS